MDLQTFGSAIAPELDPQEAANLRPNTLDEPVWQTLLRDLKRIGIKIWHVCLPRGRGPAALRDWDWWGPLVLCFALAIVLAANYQVCTTTTETHGIFALVFLVVWVGSIFITLNSSLLGGNVSFFQSVCVLGYCLFPLNVASLVTLIWSKGWFVFLCVAIGWAWSTFAALGFLSAMVPDHRRVLAIYPVFLFYLVIAWLIYFSRESECTTGGGSGGSINIIKFAFTSGYQSTNVSLPQLY